MNGNDNTARPVFSHGGDWAAYQTAYGKMPLDFSSNVSPLGVPEGVVRAVARAVKEADRYPDPRCLALSERIAKAEEVDGTFVLCGNGAADLIRRIVYAVRPEKALLTAPCFTEYEAALRAVSCHVTRVVLSGENGFCLPEDVCEAVTPETDILFLSEPNNPAGTAVSAGLLSRIMARCEETGTRFVLDECFVGFMDEPERFSMKRLLATHKHTVILKAFTKIYAMAGIRLGYLLCADHGFVNRVFDAGAPWSVSHLAQEAGIAALMETDYVRRVRALIARERPRLAEGLSKAGLKVTDGTANFLLFQSDVPLVKPLKERGILIRNCADYHGLDGRCYRVAVRTEEENDRLLAALAEILI